MRINTRITSSSVLAITMLVGSVLAATTRFSNYDRHFVMEAAKGGTAEVRLGELAAGRGSSGAVRKFGQQMVTDHSQANNELLQLANRKNFTPSQLMSREDLVLQKRLQRASGRAFDRIYINAMVKDHVKDVRAFQQAGRRANDQDLRRWTRQKLPTLQHHLEMAREIQSRLRGRRM